MHEIEPFYRWDPYYAAERDNRSPYFGREPNYEQYENTIYGYYIHPDWEEIGSETLYVKVLFADYDARFCIIELLGEWNDTLHNDIMHLKRNVLDPLLAEGINRFVLLGEHVLNFHGGEDDYYSEWFEEVEDGWIAAVCFREFVEREMSRYHLDYYLNYGGGLAELENWRTMTPWLFFGEVERLIARRLPA
jgi:hypothetical protein